MSNQEDIIYQVHTMDIKLLLDLVVENPFFLTDAYYANVGAAIRARHVELKRGPRMYYSF